MGLIQLDKVEKCYESSAAALHPMSLSVDKSEKLGIVGETGSGKSTLLKIMAGLISPDSGHVLFKEEVLPDPSDQLIPGHPSIAYLSQHFELPFFRTVEEIVFDPYKIGEEDVDKLYKACHIEHLLQSDSQELSGGEKQRVALAKLLVDEPELLLLDEPFSNLDLHHQSIIKKTLESIEREFDTTIILVAHNPLDVLSWADRIIALKSGRVVQIDKPNAIYNFPKSEYIAGLFGPYNLIAMSKWGKQGDSFTIVEDQFLVRPENLLVSGTDKKGLTGKVDKIAYYGSYEQLVVVVGSEELIINAKVGEYKVGAEVYVSLQA